MCGGLLNVLLAEGGAKTHCFPLLEAPKLGSLSSLPQTSHLDFLCEIRSLFRGPPVTCGHYTTTQATLLKTQ